MDGDDTESGHARGRFDNRLTASVYIELKKIALARLRSERANLTLQPTALVNEVCLRLLGSGVCPIDRDHLLRVAARCMRHVLVDYARSKEAAKRGNRQPVVSLQEELQVPKEFSSLSTEEIIDLDRALTRLQTIDERQALVVELRFFGGLSEDETSELLQVSSRTVRRDWEISRAWLRGQLRPSQDSYGIEA
jgi:RNA polymerase sigma-70 factor (ECF subfamily)